MKAFRLKDADRLLHVHQQAWANNMAGQRKKNGHPIYRRFEKFFNYKKAIKSAKGELVVSNRDKLRNFIVNFNSRKGG